MANPEIRRACEKMIEEEGGIWGTLSSVDEIIQQWEEEGGLSLSA